MNNIIFIFHCMGQCVWTLDDMLDHLYAELFCVDSDISDKLILDIAETMYTPFMCEVEIEEFTDFRYFVLCNNQIIR